MKNRTYVKMLPALLLLFLFCTGCKEETDNPNVLTNIYTPVFTELSLENATSVSDIRETDDGYRYVSFASNRQTMGVGDKVTETFAIYETDKTGAVTKEIPLDPNTASYNCITTGERGIYSIVLEDSYMFYHIDWEGNTVAKIDCSDIRPKGGTNTPTTSNLGMGYPLAETSDGIALVWGKVCLLLDENLALTGEIPLPGTGENVFCEKDTVWLVYQEEGRRVLGKVTDGAVEESWVLPAILEGMGVYYWTIPIAIEEGWFYGWNANAGVVRWQFAAEEETIEQVMDFSNSGIPGSRVRAISKLSDELYSVMLNDKNGYTRQLNLYKTAPDKDLSQITVLTLACMQKRTMVEEAVLAFNAAHADVYIKIVTYDQYNTVEGYEGYDRFQMDLTTGILKADILVNETFDPIDLYPLMTGEVQKDDIAPCVRNQYEKDGKLDRIGSRFTVNMTVGREDTVGEIDGWDLEEFLTYVENLPAGEYLMEEVCRDNASSVLFGSGGEYAPFIQDGVADFENELYLRYLAYLSTLPEEPQKYMDYGKNNSAALFAGEITEDQLVIEEGGENLYYNGKIKLYHRYGANSLAEIMTLAERFGTTDLHVTGVPTESGSGIQVGVQDYFSIPSTCQNPALAWELIETALLMDSNTASPRTTDFQEVKSNLFATLYKPYLAWLDTMKGYQQFKNLVYNGTQFGYDFVLDENGRYKDQPGILTELDDNLMTFIKEIFETAGEDTYVPWDVVQIAREEESRYLAGAISAEECARIVQSRVGIWLAENS